MIRLARFGVITFLFLALACHAARAAEPHRLVAGTELISDIARDLLPGNVEILTLAPASSCPGHHDIRASDMAFFSKAGMVIIHGWQRNSPGIPEAMQAARMPKEALFALENRGSLLVPENQIAVSREVAGFLSGLRGVDAAALEERLQDRIRRIEALAAECGEIMAPFAGTPALSAFMQEEFVGWTGMNVVAHYGRGEDMSPGALMKLVDTGKRRAVMVVVDNLQSGADAGEPLAHELRAAHVAFSNFPMFSPEAPTYESLVRLNVTLLHDALSARLKNGD